MKRYSRLEDHFYAREIVLLKSFPCKYGKCAFCNYILDNSSDENAINAVNEEVLKSVTGEFKSLEVINSGSVFELPKKTLDLIKQKVKEKNIKLLYFEAFFSYMNRLDEIRAFFSECEVRFIIGIESFDDKFRRQVLNKNFTLFNKNNENFQKVVQNYFCVLLMVCIKGQTKDQILKDIELATTHFPLCAVSVFVPNETKIKRDDELLKWFLAEVYEDLKHNPKVEILLDNKDFGVFVQ